MEMTILIDFTLAFVNVVIKIFLNHKQHKNDMYINMFFPFVSFIKVIIVIHKFVRKWYLIL